MSCDCVGPTEIPLLPVRATVHNTDKPCSASFLENGKIVKPQIDEVGVEITTVCFQG